jgi:CRP-like cAMP-binding protein/Fe-S-cluster-containing hydrogenase component 2
VAKTVVNPTAELSPRSGDVILSLEQLAVLAVFASVKKAPTFSKFPGSYVLRHYQPGEVICHQGQPGQSAFYMLTSDDLAVLSQSGEEGTANLSAIQGLHQQIGPTASQPRRLATARLLAAGTSPSQFSKGFWGAVAKKISGQAAAPALSKPQLIRNDGPTDINYETRQAPIYEGEVFGEMSCLTRQPRSATIVADQECFALEILRNVLDQMRKDPQYKQQSEQKYRERVLEGHLRSLSLFALLTPEQFRQVAGRVELVEFAPGTVLWDEGDPPDAVYVVRSGMVQVLQSFHWRLKADDVLDWPALVEALRASAAGAGNLACWWSKLSKDLQAAITNCTGEPDASLKERFLDESNRLAKTSTLLVAKDLASVLVDNRFRRDAANFDEKVKNWTELQLRRGNRILYHVLLPELISPPEPLGVQRVLRYLGRGDALGEIGLVLEQPRSATCVAFAHSGSVVEATDIELVKVPADLFHDLIQMSPQVRAEVDRMIAGRQESDLQVAAAPIHSISHSSRAEQLGLLQGQKLMLIDLDRCTRCGDCVQACINTHEDGHSRLFLDGPRFGKYLIPSSCRNCRDPVCMIGCPVGSIQQGDHGEVLIRDWCIGCGVCSRQCPYDAIQMHDESVIPAGAPGWRWTQSAQPPPANWFGAKFADRQWLTGACPFLAGIDTRLLFQALGTTGSAAGDYYFRFQFDVDTAGLDPQRTWRLLATCQGKSAEIYLDGQPLSLQQNPQQTKKGEFEAHLPFDQVRRGTHVVAARVVGPVAFNATILDLRLDLVTGEQEDVEVKLVTEKAVVCDQCSSLAGNRHACVYACPHEAALRIDAMAEFPGL